MANRIFDSVIAVDSAMGDLSVIGGASSNITSFHVSAIAFWRANTTGDCIISGPDTTNHIIRFSLAAVATNNGMIESTQSISFPSPLVMSGLKCPLLTAGSAWIYLS